MYDVVYVGDVKTTGRYVCCYENTRLGGLESVQWSVSRLAANRTMANVPIEVLQTLLLL